MGVPRILAMVMAGGEGSRLYPLTADRSKPAVPFGGRYRIVDFVLSNLVNSEIYAIYLLVQYRSQSLIEHVRRAWTQSSLQPGHFVTVVPPQMRTGTDWFLGTADAVYQNLNLIVDRRPSLVAVFGADHIYRMDIQQMVRFHQEREADVTVAALPVPIEQAGAFGVIVTDRHGRVLEFQEKPANPVPMPGDPRRVYASMGNYLFTTEVLVRALEQAHDRGEHDFGRHVLPRLKDIKRVFAYDFSCNLVPGVKPYEEPAYWRDVGTIEAYYASHADMLGLRPRLDAFNTQWPIYSSNYHGPIAKIVSGMVENSVLGGGTLVNGATVRNSTIRHEVLLDEGVVVEDSIISDYVMIERGCHIRRAIIDRYNIIKAGTRIGFDPEEDRKRYHVSESGIVVVRTGYRGLDLVY
ncbi:MAG: glucose-1-phosphate adenylyltransferase [Gammaproteobacteria bacterium]